MAMTTHDLSSDDETKVQPVEYVDHKDGVDDLDTGMSAEELARFDKALLRKLDMKLIPWLTLLYLCSFLDRTNIGNAKLDGLLIDCNLTGGQYNACLSIFFVSYALAEPVTNILLKRMSPRIFLTGTMIAWGIVMTCMGLVHNFAGLATARFFLGLAEAGLFPGVNYYLSCWYKREEFGKRAAIFFSAAALAGSFGGLLAAAIAQMKGVGGKAGWSWIFILEGLATILVGCASYWMVHDFPDEARFLTPLERTRVIKRLREDKQASAEHEEFQAKYFWSSVKDWKTLAFAITYMGAVGALYAFSLFLPTIIAELGFKSTQANLLSVPPYAAAAIVTVSIGFIADHVRERGIFNIGLALIGMVGFSMQLGSQRASIKYAGTFLGAIGIYPCIPNTIVWASNNVEGVFKRGVTMGIMIGWGNLNGVVSSNIYRQKDKPKFYLGHSVVLAYMTLFLLGGSIVTRFALQAENKKRLRGKRDVWVEGRTEQEIKDLGDKRPDFIYTL